MLTQDEYLNCASINNTIAKHTGCRNSTWTIPYELESWLFLQNKKKKVWSLRNLRRLRIFLCCAYPNSVQQAILIRARWYIISMTVLCYTVDVMIVMYRCKMLKKSRAQTPHSIIRCFNFIWWDLITIDELISSSSVPVLFLTPSGASTIQNFSVRYRWIHPH